jgi:ABC-type multidrug transport system ATPase subunit
MEVLVADNVKKNYGRHTALDEVSFNAKQGEVLGILGPNGAGKTTLIKCCLGLLDFDGQITVDGVDVKTAGAVARARMGYVPQRTTLHDKLSIIDEVKLIGRLKGVNDNHRFREILERLGFWERRKSPVGSLSQGMKQKLMLGLTLLTEPDILLLDEPLSSIDIEGQISLLRQLDEIKKEDKSILISSHIVGMGSVIDRVLVLNRGEVVAFGGVEEVLGKLHIRNKLYIKLHQGDAHDDDLVNVLRENNVYSVQSMEGWLIIECDSKDKAKLIASIFEHGIRPEDIVSEALSLERHYYELIKG